jgi:hypothetical protein
MRELRPLQAIAAAVIGLSCSPSPVSTVRSAKPQAANDPCVHRRSNDSCMSELPTGAPVVPAEGWIWGLFARRGGFEIREYSATTDSVLARGTCPSGTSAAVLGVVDTQPAVVCADFGKSRVVFGRKVPNSQRFIWQAPESLSHDPNESVNAISHFALLERRLAVVYRTEMTSLTSGLRSTQWRLQIASEPSRVAGAAPVNASTVPAQSELLCPRANVTLCDRAPVTAYVADLAMHVVLASGVSGDRYLHLQQAPGQPSKTLPVADVSLPGKQIKTPCVSKSADGNLRVFVPSRTLVSALGMDQGQRVGVIEHGSAAIAQGPDVFAGSEELCPPEVSALDAFPYGSPAASAPQARPQQLRATHSQDKWIVGYGVPQFAVKEGDVLHAYKESFWVVRR